jgi:hypothetical protein
MSSSICEKYSGVVINQNQAKPFALSSQNKEGKNLWFYQTFRLPSEYRRGTEFKEQRYPGLSGFQIQVSIPEGEASSVAINYTIDQYFFGVSWGNLTHGQVTGAHTDGEKVWLDIFLPKEIVVTKEFFSDAGSLLRIGFQNVSKVEDFWYSFPNPYSQGTALENAEEPSGTLKIEGHEKDCSFNFRILGLTADSGTDYLGNPYRSAVVQSSAQNAITTDGENSGYWLSQPQPSRFAVVSYYADLRPFPEVPKYEIVEGKAVAINPEAKEEGVVIDSLLLDPITPGVAFNIYYSNDLVGSGTSEPTEKEWEEKLWTRVPKSWVTSKRQTYVLPEPVTAKFVKVEFSYLQAKSYNPGNYQLPKNYKKFPDWVSQTFIAALKTPEFIAQNVGVVFDALEFSYQYYLGDLSQAPINPSIIRPAESSNQVDATTLEKINLQLNTYTNPPAVQANSSTLLGSLVSQKAFDQINYPVEGTPEFSGVVHLGVSGLNREGIVLDQSMPVMYFFLTCRHAYKELLATFDNNRAYFAGVNELSFIRNVYTTTSDSELYIESGNDDVNSERNDFVLEDNDWFTY